MLLNIFPLLSLRPLINSHWFLITIDTFLPGRHLAGSVVKDAWDGGVRHPQTGLLWISEQAAGTRKENILANRLVEAVLRAERRCAVLLRRRERREGVRCRLPSRLQSAQQRTHFRWQEARVRIAATRPHAEELHLRHGIRDGQETVAWWLFYHYFSYFISRNNVLYCSLLTFSHLFVRLF